MGDTSRDAVDRLIHTLMSTPSTNSEKNAAATLHALMAERDGWRSEHERVCQEAASCFGAANEIDAAWEAIGTRGNRGALALDEQVSSLLRELDAAEDERDALRALLPSLIAAAEGTAPEEMIALARDMAGEVGHGEPIYIAQTKLGTLDENIAWLEEQRICAFERYCTFSRVTGDEQTGLLLLEAWYEQPDDQGEPRWMLTDAAPAPASSEVGHG